MAWSTDAHTGINIKIVRKMEAKETKIKGTMDLYSQTTGSIR